MSEPRMYPGMSPDERTHFAPYSAFEIPADLRELHGRYDVESTARRVRNFRYAEEWMMMIMGGWLGWRYSRSIPAWRRRRGLPPPRR